MRRVDLDPRRTAADGPVSLPHRMIGPRRSCLHFVAAALGILALPGCDALISMPDAALLKQQGPPGCHLKAEREKRKPTVASTGDGGGDKARLERLDYEAQCYRQAEMIVRRRLGRLQRSIRNAAKAQQAAARRSAATFKD